jgi:hypothetical protein
MVGAARRRRKKRNKPRPIEDERRSEIKRRLLGLMKMLRRVVTVSRALLALEVRLTSCKSGNWRKRLEKRRKLERRGRLRILLRTLMRHQMRWWNTEIKRLRMPLSTSIRLLDQPRSKSTGPRLRLHLSHLYCSRLKVQASLRFLRTPTRVSQLPILWMPLKP